MSLLFEMTMNLIVGALLIATIAYCWTLNKRIRILQDSRTELAELLKHFDESTKRASDSILALQAASKKIGETIQARIEKANYVADDLTFLIERAGKISAPVAAPARPAAEDEAVQAARAIEKARAAVEAAAPARQPSTNTLQSMLEKLATKVSDPATRIPRPKAPSARSRVEQELMDVIKLGSQV